MKEKQITKKYSIIELKRNGIYEYYLSKTNEANLMFIYGTENECFPTKEMVKEYINAATEINFWGDYEN